MLILFPQLNYQFLEHYDYALKLLIGPSIVPVPLDQPLLNWAWKCYWTTLPRGLEEGQKDSPYASSFSGDEPSQDQSFGEVTSVSSLGHEYSAKNFTN